MVLETWKRSFAAVQRCAIRKGYHVRTSLWPEVSHIPTASTTTAMPRTAALWAVEMWITSRTCPAQLHAPHRTSPLDLLCAISLSAFRRLRSPAGPLLISLGGSPCTCSIPQRVHISTLLMRRNVINFFSLFSIDDIALRTTTVRTPPLVTG